ncbi:sodium-dependent nutrient amino acid transporter 1 [Diachasma alloeum]|uniref:sodium-dependent nutrient amino acid transporter 1 n=1 Tax=Diachasma alloeum TaxID=454923 RepID=UPI0007383B5A|nr:sodium-dependent nutrient amino acid transporter 1 [Diachasma alloeum]
MEKFSNGARNGHANEGFDAVEKLPDDLENLGCQGETPPVIQSEEKPEWSGNLQFLMACIATSVGLGNVWRFPYTAYENGGGAFLIPYIIILVLVGKPFYYLEAAIGQFTSRSCTGLWNITPAMRGLGFGQAFVGSYVVSYYCSLMALALLYLVASFQSELPWSYCWDEWTDPCVSQHSNLSEIQASGQKVTGSAELYFRREVLKETDSIESGIGLPSWKLTICLALTWLCVFIVLHRGIKETGKAVYFFAIFPYIIMLALLIRAVTLEGAVNGILFFITPNWNKLWDPNVWYAAITQCFFSLSVCFGPIVTYSSHNRFFHPMHRDVMIVTTLDTLTSFMAGCTIFGILGNLAYEMGTDDIGSVVRGGSGLAFISYPDALGRFSFVPQLFSVLFFVMIFVLGLGTAMALAGTPFLACCEYMPNAKKWVITLVISVIGFGVGLVYITPGGQWLVALVDYYGGTLVAIVIGVLEIISIFWIYGLNNFLDDVEFMLGVRPGILWRLCWLIITPALMIVIMIYTFVIYSPLTHDGKYYPNWAYATGWILFFLAMVQIPGWIFYYVDKHDKLPIGKAIKAAFAPSPAWGPKCQVHREKWLEFINDKKSTRKKGLRQLLLD